MPHELIHFIGQYGYIAMFCMVFVQELGVPGFPNEIALLYFGYLSKSLLFFPLVCMTVVAADISGSCILFFVTYYFSPLLLRIKPKWLFSSTEKWQRLKARIQKNQEKAIFLGRLTPFLRGYISAIAGFVKTAPPKYIRTILFSAIVWNTGWILAGWLIAQHY